MYKPVYHELKAAEYKDAPVRSHHSKSFSFNAFKPQLNDLKSNKRKSNGFAKVEPKKVKIDETKIEEAKTVEEPKEEAKTAEEPKQE